MLQMQTMPVDFISIGIILTGQLDLWVKLKLLLLVIKKRGD